MSTVLEKLQASILQTIAGISSMEAGETDDFGLDMALVNAVEPIFDWLYTDYWRVQVLGAQTIPEKGRALIVSNHSGGLPYDGAMMNIALRKNKKRFVRFLVEDFVFHSPFLGMFMNRLGGVRACPENAVRLLERGDLVSVFPEGVKGLGKLFEDRYKLARFGRGGFVRIASETETPIVPCAIVGAEEIHPILWKSDVLAKSLGIPYLPVTPTFPALGPLGLVPLPSQWVMAFGEPIMVPKKMDPLKVHEWTQKIRGVIQRMLKEMLQARRSVWKF